jgi:hypothetical protein
MQLLNNCFVKNLYTQTSFPFLFSHLPLILNHTTTSMFEGREKGTGQVRWEKKEEDRISKRAQIWDIKLTMGQGSKDSG